MAIPPSTQRAVRPSIALGWEASIDGSTNKGTKDTIKPRFYGRESSGEGVANPRNATDSEVTGKKTSKRRFTNNGSTRCTNEERLGSEDIIARAQMKHQDSGSVKTNPQTGPPKLDSDPWELVYEGEYCSEWDGPRPSLKRRRAEQKTEPAAPAATAPTPIVSAATAPTPIVPAATAPTPTVPGATAPTPIATATTAPIPRPSEDTIMAEMTSAVRFDTDGTTRRIVEFKFPTQGMTNELAAVICSVARSVYD